jgi:hypothetical protein
MQIRLPFGTLVEAFGVAKPNIGSSDPSVTSDYTIYN